MSGATDEANKEKSEIDYQKLVWQCLLTVGSHPITQARVLIQLGHEPAAAFYRDKGGKLIPFLASSGWFHKGILTGYLRDANLFPATMDTIGVGMLYKVIETTTSSITQTVVEKPIKNLLPEKVQEDSFEGVLVSSTKEFLIKAAGIVISRPFYVIAVRQIGTIAQGTNDLAILKPLKEVIMDGSLFAGIVPKLTYEACVILMGNTFIYLYNTNLRGDDPDENVQKLLPSIINMAVATFCYPLHLVSTIMCVNGSGLVLDEFHELGWIQILSKLRSRKLHARGHSMLFSRKVPDIALFDEGTPV